VEIAREVKNPERSSVRPKIERRMPPDWTLRTWLQPNAEGDLPRKMKTPAENMKARHRATVNATESVAHERILKEAYYMERNGTTIRRMDVHIREERKKA